MVAQLERCLEIRIKTIYAYDGKVINLLTNKQILLKILADLRGDEIQLFFLRIKGQKKANNTPKVKEDAVK